MGRMHCCSGPHLSIAEEVFDGFDHVYFAMHHHDTAGIAWLCFFNGSDMDFHQDHPTFGAISKACGVSSKDLP